MEPAVADTPAPAPPAVEVAQPVVADAVMKEEEPQKDTNKRGPEDQGQEEPASKKAHVETETTAQPAPTTGPNLDTVIFGLPKFMDQKRFGKFLASQSLTYKKIKKIANQEFGFVHFETVEQKEASKKLEGFELKGKKLTLQDKKGKPTSGAHNTDNRGRNKNNNNNNNNTAETDPQEPPNVNQALAPLWKTPYADQLKIKQDHAKSHDTKGTPWPAWIKNNRVDPIPFEGVRLSPLTSRNKLQFTIEYDGNGAPCIGFVSGKFLEGQKIMSPEEAVIVPDLALQLRNAFQEFIISSPFAPYNLVTQQGFWRLLTVKAYARTNEVMAIIQIKNQGISLEEVEKEKTRLKEFVTAKKEAGLAITSVMWQDYSGVAVDSPVDVPCTNIWGESYVHEKLFDQTFRISPHAFFQTNTLGAEIIYGIVRDWCSPTRDSLLLDLCCGTGTIGQCIASQVKEVIGIELSEEAVNDARFNAELNGHKNTKYIASKVEDVFSQLSFPAGPIIAVVDPPRAGMHKKVLNAIRNNNFIKRLVYVSCEPKSLIADCSVLCRASSRNNPGQPFVPIRSIGIDMFPHTNKLEMVMLFERKDPPKPSPSSSITPSSTNNNNITKFDDVDSSSSSSSVADSVVSSSSSSSSSSLSNETQVEPMQQEPTTVTATDSTQTTPAPENIAP